MLSVTPEKLAALHKSGPRYTSYPTAVEWKPLEACLYQERLLRLEDPLALYIHIPFCEKMCLYCGCSVVLNRREEKEREYVELLCKEIALVGAKKRVVQLHFGGGTPTKLSEELFAQIMETLHRYFKIEGEVAIEIDPRTVSRGKLEFYRRLGFNRVSFGVQDTNEKVQEAVKRRQSLAMTQETFWLARELGFAGINIDLIYGLPYQTVETFAKTAEEICKMRPDRIALFSYAKVPWLKAHQKAIREETLPSTEEKFQIYANARNRFIEEGYIAIGMDHFALAEDELAIAYRTGKLQRNFQGYSVSVSKDQLGFGMSAIGALHDGYFQNYKDLEKYYKALREDRLPIERGIILSPDDHIRKWVIHTLMCHFKLDKGEFYTKFGIPFDDYFSVESDELLIDGECLEVTELGELFIRNVAMRFDRYYTESQKHFSQTV